MVTRVRYFFIEFFILPSHFRIEQLLRWLNVNPTSGEKHMKIVNSILEIFKFNCQLAYKPKTNLLLDKEIIGEKLKKGEHMSGCAKYMKANGRISEKCFS